jgi:hypothetical protein
MRTLKTVAIVAALFAGAFALIAYSAALSDQGDSATLGYMWLMLTAALAVVVASIVLARPAVYDPRAPLAGQGLLWLGVFVLNVLLVLLVIWLFVPSLTLSHRLFSNLGGSLTPGILVMDIGIMCVLVGHTVAKWG